VTYRRQQFLIDQAIRKALREAIRSVQAIKPFTVNAWMLLPDHLHCIWAQPTYDADFSI